MKTQKAFKLVTEVRTSNILNFNDQECPTPFRWNKFKLNRTINIFEVNLESLKHIKEFREREQK